MKQGDAYFIEVDFEDEILTGIVKETRRRGAFFVFIPGVCNCTMVQEYDGTWVIEVGVKIIPEVVQAIGREILLLFSFREP